MTALVPLTLPVAGCVTVVDREGELALKLVGEIDVETISAYERTPSPVVDIAAVDLSEVSFLSSSAVSFLIRKTQPMRRRGQLPAIAGVSAHARRVLEMLGATRLFAPL